VKSSLEIILSNGRKGTYTVRSIFCDQFGWNCMQKISTEFWWIIVCFMKISAVIETL